MQSFEYTATPARVVFGHGTRSSIAAEMDRLGVGRALIVTTPQQVSLGEEARKTLGGKAVGLYTKAAMHTPSDVTVDAMKYLEETGADCIVAAGGGSTIGLGKALAYRTDLPVIAIPTTYAGSEATPILGQTEDGEKRTLIDQKVLPKTIIYDVDLVMTLPLSMTVTSIFNAMAHALEAIYAPNSNPVTTNLAHTGVKALLEALDSLERDSNDKVARSKALYGAWLCGTVLGQSTMGLHHKLCHLLGGTFNTPHAETHAIVVPHAIAYNEPSVGSAYDELRTLFGSSSVAQAIYDLQRRHGVEMKLAAFGFSEDNIAQAVSLAAKRPYPNPAPLEESALRTLLTNACNGRPPAV